MPEMRSPSPRDTPVHAVVVTYNRKALLIRCVDALLNQTRPPETVRIMDNGSGDGTEALVRRRYGEHPSVVYRNLGRNLGGAGGFHYGAADVLASGADWAWLMDDDCLPAPDCLEHLLAAVAESRDVYSPLVLSLSDRSTPLWGITAEPDTGNIEVGTLPFNGFLIHRSTLAAIGLPEKDFFIYGDDTEYNLRARRSGRRIVMATASRLYHPHKNDWRSGQLFAMFSSPIWIYYKLRNAVAIYRRYGYVSVNQCLMLLGALGWSLALMRWNRVRLWLRALADGFHGRLGLRDL